MFFLFFLFSIIARVNFNLWVALIVSCDSPRPERTQHIDDDNNNFDDDVS